MLVASRIIAPLHFNDAAISGVVEFYWTQEWPKCGQGGGQRRFDSSDGRSLGITVPCASRGLKGRVLSLVASYWPVSGTGFDQEQRVSLMHCRPFWGRLPPRSDWVVGGDFNAEIGCLGIGEASTLRVHAHGRRTRAGHGLVEWAIGEGTPFLAFFH